jgi:hypothetical protein
MIEVEDWPEAVFSAAMEVFGEDGWDDPAMDIYNLLDPRQNHKGRPGGRQ